MTKRTVSLLLFAGGHGQPDRRGLVDRARAQGLRRHLRGVPLRLAPRPDLHGLIAWPRSSCWTVRVLLRKSRTTISGASGVVKNRQAFMKAKRMSSGLDSACRLCRSTRRREHRHENIEHERAIDNARYHRTKDRNRAYILMKNYGLTVDEYDAMVGRQAGLCAICERTPIGRGKDNVLHVDHDHNEGQVRELLCSTCNSVLGFMNEDPALLEAAAAYLRKWGK